ncbi:hypothetical protein EIL87_19805 [Saccharopolyspora rhizosphaerae]|uniref:Uncharacterized protein n=1 Tax=Saccharopolyspora rhizosphaerae TaxID=2492662 RepID=A0A3R8Q0S9_9PSEU|nr:hypothetical protein [Saccharopolyspora rhizosphaerae]RRO14551.1 hypothetical protein EIL87_19805 [Saccharopolyspora rhizosphaerae]
MFNIRVFVIRQATPPAKPEDKNPTEKAGGQKGRARPRKWVGRLGRVIALLVSGANLMGQLPINFF